MAGGRPPEHDLEKLAHQLIEWSFLPDSLNLIGFSSPRRISVTKLPDFAVRDPKFREALNLAKENIAQNRFKASCAGLMPQVFYSRSEGMYDPLYHKYDREEKKFDSDLRKDEEGSKAATINLTVPHDLGAGLKLSASPISNKDNQSS